MLPWERDHAFQSRGDVFELLSLANEHLVDEHGNARYVFQGAVARAVLHVDRGVSVRVDLLVPGQEDPIASANVEDCVEFRPVREPGCKFIEFIGELRSVNAGHQSWEMKSGIRLAIEPAVVLNLFFGTDDQRARSA